MAEKPVIGVMPLYDEKMDSIWTVSYTHLILPIDAGMASDVNDIPKIKVSYGTDVYKRQM